MWLLRRSRRQQLEIEAEYLRGQQHGIASARPFRGIPGLAEFPDERTPHVAVMAYERRLLAALPTAYNRIRIAERDKQRGSYRSAVEHRGTRPPLDAAEKARDDLINELERVRLWLDAFVESAEEYVAARPKLRGEILPPALPASARRYASIDAFVAENRERGVSDWESRQDATGADFGYDWTWQDPERPWVISTWRVSYIDELKELYACENSSKRHTPYVSFDGEDKRPRAIWLLASGFEVGRPDEHADDMTWPDFISTSSTWEFLIQQQRNVMRRRNSLVLLAEAVVAQARIQATADPVSHAAEMTEEFDEPS